MGWACSGEKKDAGVTASFEPIAPEAAGFSSEKLKPVIKHCEEIGSAALLGLYDGKAFISWGRINQKYECRSIRKAYLSALYGIYVGRGKIDLNKTLRQLNIDDIPPELTADEKEARIIDLIRSRSGVYHEAASEAADMIAQRPKRGSHAPGTFFYYNNWDFNALGTIFQQETGEKIFEAFEKEIAVPLGMKHFKASDGHYVYQKERSMHPAYHFPMSAVDMALFGLLYQRDGVWEGRQIIPKAWIAESTRAHSVYDAEAGLYYGYMWYVLPEEAGLGRAYLHTGMGVHMLAVFHDLKLVLIHRVDTENPYIATSQDLYTLVDLIFAAMHTDAS
jgi:CubicO group peptidase (beta-lactamase class C family)